MKRILVFVWVVCMMLAGGLLDTQVHAVGCMQGCNHGGWARQLHLGASLFGENTC